jgi:hypothetical protein
VTASLSGGNLRLSAADGRDIAIGQTVGGDTAGGITAGASGSTTVMVWNIAMVKSVRRQMRPKTALLQLL